MIWLEFNVLRDAKQTVKYNFSFFIRATPLSFCNPASKNAVLFLKIVQDRRHLTLCMPVLTYTVFFF